MPGSIIAAPQEPHVRPTRKTPLVVPVPKATPAYKYTFHVLSEHPEITDRYDEIILANSLKHGMNPRLVKAIIAAESEFATEALSPHGARGLMQVLPITAEELGVPRSQLHDPEANIRVGTAYLERLYRAAWKQYKLKGVKYKDAPLWVVERIIASYNAGPRALTRNSFMHQTRNYVRKVLLFYRSDVSEFRRSPKRAGARLPPAPPGPPALRPQTGSTARSYSEAPVTRTWAKSPALQPPLAGLAVRLVVHLGRVLLGAPREARALPAVHDDLHRPADLGLVDLPGDARLHRHHRLGAALLLARGDSSRRAKARVSSSWEYSKTPRRSKRVARDPVQQLLMVLAGLARVARDQRGAQSDARHALADGRR